MASENFPKNKIFHITDKPAYLDSIGLDPIACGTATKYNDMGIRDAKSVQWFAILYLIKGYGHLSTPMSKSDYVEEGSFFILTPNIPHTYGPPPDVYWEEMWFIFDGKLPREYLRNEIIDPRFPAGHYGKSKEIKELFYQAFKLAESKSSDASGRIADILFSLLRRCLAVCKEKPLEISTSIITDVIEEMKDAVGNPYFDLKGLAEKYDMSYSNLRHQFKKFTGESPVSYFNRLKVEKACGWLIEKQVSIKEISQRLGFKDSSYFSRVFKKNTGFYPTRFNEVYGFQK